MWPGHNSLPVVVGEEYAHEQTCTSALVKGGAMPVHLFMPYPDGMQPLPSIRRLERVNTFLFRELMQPSVGGFS